MMLCNLLCNPSLIYLCWCTVQAEWEVLASCSFVDAARSQSWLARALYIPWYSAKHNANVQYVLLKRRSRSSFLAGFM